MKVCRLLIVLLSIFMPCLSSGQDGGFYVPDPGKATSSRVRMVHAEQREGYECRLIEYNADQERVRAYLLVPDAASFINRCPAVVMLHDHGARFDIGKEKLVRPLSATLPGGDDDHIFLSSLQWVGKYFDGVHMADSLASLGYVVLVADALYWGERSSESAQKWSEMSFSESKEMLASDKKLLKALKTQVYEGQREVYDSLLSRGEIWAEKILKDDITSVRLLKKLPFVDKRNIGAFGFSMGAHRCWLLSAFCEDVKCGVALSWMTTLEGYDADNASDLSMRIQQMRDRMDFGDIGSYLCPKPMLFMSGTSDRLFPVGRVQIAFKKLQDHYSDYNRNARIQIEPPFEPLQTVFFDGGHHCGKEVQSFITDFLDSNLK